MLDLQAFRDAPLQRDPFDHLVVPRFIMPDALGRIAADFPKIDGGGSYPLAALAYGPSFQRLTDALQDADMSAAVADKFGLALDGRPTMLTVRGRCRASDGQIHTDSQGKLITVLIYLNEGWQSENGRLRLLRSPTNIDDFAVEVPPDAGTLLAFRCSETAWHGHTSFEGERRSVQLNWVEGAWYLRKEQLRHRMSALFKKARY